ncbi:hypothetical protein Scep_024111 [Stephania cephalantha]|uniref:Uncharacterized protein n=1 Tax=Stephania cephalantha TaxID=152367 RepID=A0AAP0HXY7_9MAGN
MSISFNAVELMLFFCTQLSSNEKRNRDKKCKYNYMFYKAHFGKALNFCYLLCFHINANFSYSFFICIISIMLSCEL